MLRFKRRPSSFHRGAVATPDLPDHICYPNVIECTKCHGDGTFAGQSISNDCDDYCPHGFEISGRFGDPCPWCNDLPLPPVKYSTQHTTALVVVGCIGVAVVLVALVLLLTGGA